MRLKYRCLMGAAVVASIVGSSATAETLDQAIASAFATNPQLDIQRYETDVARESLAQARSGGRATVDVVGSAGYEYVDTTSPFAFGLGDRPIASAQVQAVQPLYTGGRVSAGIRQAKAGINAAKSQYDAAQQDMILQVVTAYVDVRSDREAVSIRKNNVDVTGEQVRAADDRFEVGVVTRTDVSLSKARLEGARAALAGAEAALEASEANYQFLTSLKPGDLPPPPPVPPLPGSVDEAVLIALDGNPDIQAARHSERAANEAIAVAKSQYRPQISIVGTAGVEQTYGDPEQRNTSVSAVAQGRIPILSGGLIKSQVSEARLRRDQARQQIDLLERQVRAQIAQAWYGYDASLRAIEASRRQVDAAEIAYDGAKEELAVGVRTTLDVLDQEQQLFEARLALVQSERDAYVAAFRLLRAAGELDKPIPTGAAPESE
ncbi:MAG: TolC family outer membrane protein [Alphaproteobacteria bacterium]|uniref:TolC family outer membrane protein n=1 Tax=Hyphomonas sp. TaxID=87 RepID=UPI001DA0CDB9|nr:TolC family outer membrane protein [Alphaproteobacteria bacterium]MBU2083423.1 TolC family outer membrane protein [Alphaproteobacteria bacterium]MBU2143612.1 TolC family outer membrane protein [Alphaproteobacteria bacterium]MBU2195987.1 TolC family outer membrane protein [Alphaproteobacteria bacterium]